MKRQFPFLSLFQPLYVVIAGSIGIIAANVLFIRNWESPFWNKVSEDALAQVPIPVFIAYVFIVAITLAFLAVIILPLWKLLFDLIREGISENDTRNKLGTIFMLILGGMSFFFALQSFLQFSGIRIAPEKYWPAGLTERVETLLVCIIFTILPVPLMNLLLYGKAYEVTYNKIPSLAGDEISLLKVAHDLLRYRNLLQNNLLIIGIATSIVPLITAVGRSMIIAYEIALGGTGEVENMWPAFYPIVYGLGFTTVLVMFYVPTHLMLNQAGMRLRDTLCPINDLADIEAYMKKRKELDEWLQTNLDLVQNLKAGIATLAPLITGFLTSIPGLKIF